MLTSLDPVIGSVLNSMLTSLDPVKSVLNAAINTLTPLDALTPALDVVNVAMGGVAVLLQLALVQLFNYINL